MLLKKKDNKKRHTRDITILISDVRLMPLFWIRAACCSGQHFKMVSEVEKMVSVHPYLTSRGRLANAKNKRMAQT